MAKSQTKMKTVRIAVSGVAGRMGRRLVALAQETAGLALVAAVEAAGHEALGADAGTLAGVGELGVPVTATLPPSGVDVVIDFSLPAATRGRVAECARSGAALILGTTGLDAATEAALAKAAKKIAIVRAPNMSVGVNVLLKTAAELAQTLGPAYDIEIVEAHHRFKKDAPSGTALGLAQAIAAATGRDLAQDARYGRAGVCPRKEILWELAFLLPPILLASVARVVLGHVPNFAMSEVQADLLVAAHTHGGQVRFATVVDLADPPARRLVAVASASLDFAARPTSYASLRNRFAVNCAA